MTSATINTTIATGSASLLVIFPHWTGSDTKLNAELLVIKEWFVAFNSNVPDIKGTQPDSTDSYPAAVILVTSNFHVSTARKSERAHITGRISTAAAWALDPKENGCCVHIYAKNNTTADGYDNWLIKNTSNSKLSSGLIITSVATALANNRGVFGEA